MELQTSPLASMQSAIMTQQLNFVLLADLIHMELAEPCEVYTSFLGGVESNFVAVWNTVYWKSIFRSWPY